MGMKITRALIGVATSPNGLLEREIYLTFMDRDTDVTLNAVSEKYLADHSSPEEVAEVLENLASKLRDLHAEYVENIAQGDKEKEDDEG